MDQLFVGLWRHLDRQIFRHAPVHLLSVLDQVIVGYPENIITINQTLANRGSALTFGDEANSTRSSPKPRQSLVIKLMVQPQVTC